MSFFYLVGKGLMFWKTDVPKSRFRLFKRSVCTSTYTDNATSIVKVNTTSISVLAVRLVSQLSRLVFLQLFLCGFSNNYNVAGNFLHRCASMFYNVLWERLL